ncbi:MAG: ATP-binding protein [Firmicutes bacterium]|nr:ATP-binding protein [Bacillota bacterium]
MVNLLVGHKGSGKTAKMIDMANASLNEVSGSVVFINKNHRLMYDLKYRIRVVCMEDFEQVTNVDEYIGFLYGIISQDHDIERLFIDSILKHADVHLEDLPDFLERVNEISVKYGIDFYISLSAAREELGDIVNKYKVLN